MASEGSGEGSGDAIIALGDSEIEIQRRGSGKPLLLLPGEEMLEADSAFVAGLARRFQVIIPAPPGFGRSSLPDWLTTPGDIAFLFLSLMERLKLGRVPVIGCSFGGWIAAEMAIRDDAGFSHLVLVDPYGVKLGGPTERDIADIWQIGPAKTAALTWHDPERRKRDTTKLTNDQLATITRNHEAFARYGWEPYMHNPKLKHLLYRIDVPSLLLWGEQDGIATPAYGAGYAKLIPGATLATIAEAGHYPHLEQPEAALRRVIDFIG
jgi:pimeloyl-ACP methyl ester carboxylesterase